jgi:hypothetical protein
LQAVYKSHITFFDTAEAYREGTSENLMVGGRNSEQIIRNVRAAHIKLLKNCLRSRVLLLTTSKSCQVLILICGKGYIYMVIALLRKFILVFRRNL